MATEEAQPPEGFTKATAPSTNSDDYDTEWVERPEVGEIVQGTLLDMKPECGDYDTTILELRLSAPYGDHDEGDLVCFWSTNGIDAALEENDVARGEEIAVACEGTFEIDGEDRREFALYTRD
ncbi:hypothetical protein [Natrarchaeobaculum aegyptiacum]|uniref:Uncharacterized protein n=1 Tax=Natrarchaeobaculum aegyptiacum TaxID=745377 RepID=A0A2Z2HR59_9EURY|nr:hypothetical protein [Natrarchaeobaculum aegyptiacum]ARS89641.1 hypothetical protein B1756_07755 [Natrarchaeobaculum aegyptiacum]